MPTTSTAEAPPRAGALREAPPWTGELRDVMELGRGGMGVVWLVLDDAGRSFARKSLLPELSRSKEKRELFLREATVALELRHPNVVRTHEVGDRDGEPYLVMDFVDGLPLDRLLARAHELGDRLPRALAAHLVASLARGLHAAHELRDEAGTPLNLVHRDVSPQNVMVSRSGDVVLLDFGVAKTDTAHGLTKTGEVRGKTAYMSPEQGLGDPLDRRSDLFALGALLYECVEDTRMWQGATEMDVLRKLALEEPPRLSGDDALVDLHASLVARSPGGRPATALEVHQQLLAYTRDGGASDDATHATRRAELADWVERVAEAALDERAKVLSSAIEPVRASLPGQPPTEPGADEAPGVVSKTHVRVGATQKAAFAVVALVAALAATVVFAGTRHGREALEPALAPPPSATNAAVDAGLLAPVASVATSASAGPAVDPPPPKNARPSTSLAPRAPVAPSTKPVASAPTPKPVGSMPLNVDPTPF